jgi:5-methyltetrahydrofolate--homocysteine methyltransferase
LSSLIDRINNGDVLVGDGAMGTMLFNEGLIPGECPEKINLEKPGLLEKIAELYCTAGADIIQTNSFGGSPLKLAQYSLEDDTEKINISAVDAVKCGTKGKAYISGSCGPCGQLIKPYGDIEPETIFENFKRQIRALINAGVDLITVETMTDLSEAVLAIKASKSVSESIPVAATMTFDHTPKRFFTIMGTNIRDAIDGLIDAGADIVGSNCGNGIENMILIAEEFKKHSSVPVMIQSNAGLPVLDGDNVVYPETPEFMVEKCRKLLDAGVNIIGGCCGTTPDHISAIAKVVNEYSNFR